MTLKKYTQFFFTHLTEFWIWCIALSIVIGVERVSYTGKSVLALLFMTLLAAASAQLVFFMSYKNRQWGILAGIAFVGILFAAIWWFMYEVLEVRNPITFFESLGIAKEVVIVFMYSFLSHGVVYLSKASEEEREAIVRPTVLKLLAIIFAGTLFFMVLVPFEKNEAFMAWLDMVDMAAYFVLLLIPVNLSMEYFSRTVEKHLPRQRF